MKNKRDLGHQKSRNWKVFRRLPEVDESVSGRHNIIWYIKRELINWYRFNFKIKILKISISTITSCDDRKWRPTRSTPLCTFTKWDLSFLIDFRKITWKTSEIYGIENQENNFFFDNYRKLTNLFSVGIIFFDTTKETLSTGIKMVINYRF